jgi:muramoyltetrapeptide carboxypeptidase
VLCGYSDITALQNAILHRSGLVTYSGPHWSSFGMREHFAQTLAWFRSAVIDAGPIELTASEQWTDDPWFLDQNAREVLPNEGWWPNQPGTGSGRIVGGNLCTLNLLQGTPYMPSLRDALLVLEDDSDSSPGEFARNLTSLLQLPDAESLQGLVIGRFQRASGIARDHLEALVAIQPALAGRPVLANVDYGHTFPVATFPIGGEAALTVGAESGLTVTRH